MDRYTRYNFKQSSGGSIVPEYRASFRVQRGHGIGSLLKGLFHFVKPLLFSGPKAVGKEALKTGDNNLSDIVQRKPDQQLGCKIKTRFAEAKDTLEDKITNLTGSGLQLKRKGKPKMSHSQYKRR
jgi:hypothetical protein